MYTEMTCDHSVIILISSDYCDTQHTKKVCGRGVAWPLSRFLPWLRQAEFIWDHWELFRAEEDAILLQFEQACNALQARLGTSDTFFASGCVSPDPTHHHAPVHI